MVHQVKSWPEYFRRVLDGSKTWEARVDDRGYLEGQFLELQEWDPTRPYDGAAGSNASDFQPRGYTGRNALVKIGHIGRFLPGFPRECVVMSIELVRPGWWKHRKGETPQVEPCCERDHDKDGNCDRHPANPPLKHLDAIATEGGKISLETER